MDCTILVNRKRPLTADYIPPCLTEPSFLFDAPAGDPKRLLMLPAAEAAARLFRRGREQGITLYGISGYRSYHRQKELYLQRLKETSQDYVDRYLAPPGASEHQTGLALDVSSPAAGLELTERFADTKEGHWLAANAPLFGFILRYPKGKEEITGYSWEPWHIRYVTKSLALYLSLTGMTLEEYYEHP
ncbi:MAG: M15 family metallopeptidase [Clostridiales bacterium]|nr:M15 family metallopeptidase [Clostridiales bacterium]